jgi:hypothetical protein
VRPQYNAMKFVCVADLLPDQRVLLSTLYAVGAEDLLTERMDFLQIYWKLGRSGYFALCPQLFLSNLIRRAS